jgi:2,3-bisphosphoglycerate-independent phosphoglycerate mutase
MKTVILVGDGMGDYPIASLGGKTPLQSANLHAIRRIAAAGETRLVSTVPAGIQPGSDVANLSLLGYNPAENYSGRAPIEAAGAGIALRPDEVAFRCNLVTIRDGRMADYSADHISTPEAHALINTLQEKIGRDGLRFHPGVSYRHLLVWRDGPTALKTQPPHDIADQLAAPHLPAGARQAEVQQRTGHANLALGPGAGPDPQALSRIVRADRRRNLRGGFDPRSGCARRLAGAQNSRRNRLH